MNIERIKSVGFGIEKSENKFQKISFSRRPLGEHDILIDILYAGICHSDLHTVRNHWQKVEHYPIIPGHEILGKVVQVGTGVTKFEVGDYAGIGCMVDSCCECSSCQSGRQQDCQKAVLTYASKDWKHDNEWTQGGYSNKYVLSENFAIKIDKDADMKRVPSLMCAGITVFSPIHQANVNEDSVCGILGLGGLGHMAAQYLKALGCKKIMAIDKNDKSDFAEKLGIKFAKTDEVNETFNRQFDFIISTIPYEYDVHKYLNMMKYNGDFVFVGLPPFEECQKMTVNIMEFIMNHQNVKIWGSQIGGIEETQLCADFSIKNKIYPIVKEIEPTPEAINKAYEEMANGNIDGRYVINMKLLSDE